METKDSLMPSNQGYPGLTPLRFVKILTQANLFYVWYDLPAEKKVEFFNGVFPQP